MDRQRDATARGGQIQWNMQIDIAPPLKNDWVTIKRSSIDAVASIVDIISAIELVCR